MRARILFYVFFLGLHLSVNAQWTDTLKTVLVEAPRWSEQNSSIFILELDRKKIVSGALPNTFDLLNSQLGANTISYGQSGLIAPRIRGTNPEHTALIWNGININHAGLGQSNGFNVPFLQGQSVQMAYGGGSVPFGSSAIAASILVNDDISFRDQNELNISGSYGSFNTIQTQAAYRKSGSRNSLGLNVYRIQSENDFKYVNTSDFRRPIVRQNNAAFQQNGIKANWAGRISEKHQLRFHSWIHDGFTEIQPAMSNRNSQDRQKDHFHRYKLSHLFSSEAGLFQTDLFYTSDDIEYNGSYSGIQRYGIRTSWNKKLLSFLNSGLGINYEYFLPDYANYPENTTESRLSFYSFNTIEVGRFTGKVNVRYTAVEGYNVPFTPNASLSYRLIESKERLLKINVSYSENFRLPTLNERYWQPGGDPQILPESSKQYEFGIEAASKFFNVQLSYFNMDIVNAVQWVLKDSLWSESNQQLYRNIYSPDNISRVHSEGINSRLSLEDLEIGQFSLNSALSYNYTMARDKERQGQRLYTPYHTLSLFGGISWRKYSFRSTFNYVSERNASTRQLDPFALVGFSFSRVLTVQGHQFNLAFQVNNALDETYQTFINRAMPGRHYLITINYALHK